MTGANPATQPKRASNRTIVTWTAGFAIFMLAMAYAAVPLYDLFCRVTGFGGTTQQAESNLGGVIDREMAVRFDATIAPGLALHVVPARVETDPIGSTKTVVYRATNTSNRPLSTTASYNVTPDVTGVYFNKIECFCFTEQTLAPNETVEMPVTYFVDPAIDLDDELDTIRHITLSYTFHQNERG